MIFEFQSREGASPNANQKEKDLVKEMHILVLNTLARLLVTKLEGVIWSLSEC